MEEPPLAKPVKDQAQSPQTSHIEGMPSFKQWRPQLIIESETEGLIEPALNLLWKRFIHHARLNGYSVITKSESLAPKWFSRLALVLRIDSGPERLVICPWPAVLEFPEPLSS